MKIHKTGFIHKYTYIEFSGENSTKLRNIDNIP